MADSSQAPPPPPASHLEADDEGPTDNSDADSAVGSIGESSTASLNSSVMRFREENGRTYHSYKEGKYIAPNDNPEQERLDFQHALVLLTFDNVLTLSPAGKDGEKQIHRVLDVGTGTGCWAIDFADEHPETTVVGVDLSPIQPEFVPPNVEFQVDDMEEDWTFSTNFDFIYCRFMTASFADWPKFFSECYRNLNPGCWLEVVDILPPTSDDGSMKGTNLEKWTSLLIEATETIGRAFNGAVLYREQMQSVGFQEVTQLTYKWPQNRWPKDPKYKELGLWTLENISAALEAISNAIFTRVLGWEKNELDVFLALVRNDIKNPHIHAYWPILVVYGKTAK